MQNWKTTVAGIGGGLLMVVAAWLQTGNLADYKTLAMALFATALGYVAKDAGITGTGK